MGCKPSKTTNKVTPFEQSVSSEQTDSDVSARKRRAGVSAQTITTSEMKNWSHETSKQIKRIDDSTITIHISCNVYCSN
jgi:hypothetical protein